MRILKSFVFGAALFLSAPALADAIDGDWCHSDGRHFQIVGPQIVTPKGQRIAGNYGRHDFNYVVPAAEPDAGQTVDMRLINDQTVHLRLSGNAAAEPQVWRRCTPRVS
ncbi:MAG: hypothetical protein EXQ92_13025 [Alphaproteobacteria bacterium]|nr:hypothetical protein [Alphaproteobacteria bacterium]